MGPFEIMYDGDMSSGIPALCWKIKDGYDTKGYNLFDLADRLRSRGWQVPAYTLPANAQDVAIQRILVRHGVSRDLAALSRALGEAGAEVTLLTNSPGSPLSETARHVIDIRDPARSAARLRRRQKKPRAPLMAPAPLGGRNRSDSAHRWRSNRPGGPAAGAGPVVGPSPATSSGRDRPSAAPDQ